MTDAALDGFGLRRVGDTLTLPGGPSGVTVTLPAGGNPMLVTRAASEGGVELVAAGHEAHANDFNADGHGDLLWRHAPSGAFSTWDGQGNVLANGFVVNSYFSLAQSATTQAVASFDWNGDGRSDVLWRDAALTVHGPSLDWPISTETGSTIYCGATQMESSPNGNRPAAVFVRMSMPMRASRRRGRWRRWRT